MGFRFGTTFSGGGGYDLGAIAAGGQHVFSIEIEPDINAIRELNIPGGLHICADIRDVDPDGLPPVNLLHGSPVCTEFSTAKNGGEEKQLDITTARAFCNIIRAQNEKGELRVVTMENVWGYRKSYSALIIGLTLEELGFSYDYWHLNMANYGVPQTRKRLILIAWKRENKPFRPSPTHLETPGMFTLPWIGWYEAIEDLLPTQPIAMRMGDRPCEHHPEYLAGAGHLECGGCGQKTSDQYSCDNCGSDDVGWIEDDEPKGPPCIEGICRGHFSDWQVKRLPDIYREPTLLNTNQKGGGKTDVSKVGASEPSYTVTTSTKGRAGAVIYGNGMWSKGKPGDVPADTITANRNQKSMRVLLVGQQKGQMQDENRPAHTITAQNAVPRVMVPGGNASSFSIRAGDMPARTIGDVERVGNAPKAYVERGVIIKLDERALARLQTFPDNYRGITAKIIGLSVPPKFVEVMLTQYRPFLEKNR